MHLEKNQTNKQKGAMRSREIDREGTTEGMEAMAIRATSERKVLKRHAQRTGGRRYVARPVELVRTFAGKSRRVLGV